MSWTKVQSEADSVDLLIFRITALFENSFACVPYIRVAARIFKPPCSTKNSLRPLDSGDFCSSSARNLSNDSSCRTAGRTKNSLRPLDSGESVRNVEGWMHQPSVSLQNAC